MTSGLSASWRLGGGWPPGGGPGAPDGPGGAGLGACGVGWLGRGPGGGLPFSPGVARSAVMSACNLLAALPSDMCRSHSVERPLAAMILP